MASETSHHVRPERKGLYKVTILAYRKEGMSEEDFHVHWTNSHALKVSEHLRKHGVVGYTQYHTPSWLRKEAQEHLPALGNFTVDNAVDYDGFVELRMPELSCFENAMNDPYYADVVSPDEQSFWEFATSKITVGWEETYIDATKDGEVAFPVKGQGGHEAKLNNSQTK
ncbi:putative EthD domain-containing protein [Septoria linicola]|nr:putative EthD domain-containing protein [Septoria linicola]